jgi:hypothetical protein
MVIFHALKLSEHQVWEIKLLIARRVNGGGIKAVERDKLVRLWKRLAKLDKRIVRKATSGRYYEMESIKVRRKNARQSNLDN